jgi:hypothetical protein
MARIYWDNAIRSGLGNLFTDMWIYARQNLGMRNVTREQLTESLFEVAFG